MFIALKNPSNADAAHHIARQCMFPNADFVADFIEQLKNAELAMLASPAPTPAPPPSPSATEPPVDGQAAAPMLTPPQWLLLLLTQNGLVQFTSARQNRALDLVPCAIGFDPYGQPDMSAPMWKMSRFSYVHQEQGIFRLRNPNALSTLIIHDPAILTLLFQLGQASRRSDFKLPKALAGQADAIFSMMVWAGIIVPCTEEGISSEDTDPVQQQWEFHDLLFHASSRPGRSDQAHGPTFRFKGSLPPPPAIKPHGWTREVLNLPSPNLQELFFRDMPLTAALESRHSTRQHSPLPLTVEQLGHFLYRTARNRQVLPHTGMGDTPAPNGAGKQADSAKAPAKDSTDAEVAAVGRPYPNCGSVYEQEFYVTVNGCVGVRRGMYYYDPQHHRLCLICEPGPALEGLLDDACFASGGQCRPQILLTIANRFNRSNWKYSGISYAAQLKNIGAIYQTMYLVATAMNIAGCALGLGNTERFRQMTGLDYLAEGSVGEFMLGRPLA